uniref:Uncharacterized protein LOC108950156 n=1 Tax=Phallusia mammillata TaxID=59560 RepID=A0A6F9DJT3_9ASCI|nr:uncharacterized protein LOC108950156 [Phallusia mammillata]
MDRTFFIHDSSLLQSESDDPLLAIRSFISPKPMNSGEKCVLCGSLVTLFDSVTTITGSVPRKITLQNQVFAIARVESQITLALSCTLESKEDPVALLDMLIEIVQLRFSSFSSLLRFWSEGQISDDLLNILAHTEKLVPIDNDFEMHMKSSIFMENCMTNYSHIGSCILFREDIVHSHFDTRTTKLIVAASYFPNYNSETGKTELSNLTWFTVFVRKNIFQNIGCFDANTEKNLSLNPEISDDTDENEHISLILACLCVNQSAMLMLCPVGGFSPETTQKLEKELVALDRQLAIKVLLDEAE